jgi:phosphoribosylformimino-5-aminoimidazole carboxamide ribotide isomerase
MLIIPELQIEGGRLVTRLSAEADNNTVHDLMPLDAARLFESQGAERLHIIDVDAALGRDVNNEALIHEIISASETPVQVAGGMRTRAQIDRWFEAGASHVVLGTLAITDQTLVAQLAGQYPGAVLVNVATKDGFVMIDGWRTRTAFRPVDIAYDLQMAGVAGIIHFDINRQEGDASESLALTMEMKRSVLIPVYSSGTIRTLDDVATLRYLPDIYGTIVGDALVTGELSLEDVVAIAGQRETSPEPELESPASAHRMQGGFTIYLAAYNESIAAQWWTRELRRAITDHNPYIETVVPQQDLDPNDAGTTRRELQAAYEQSIDSCDAVVVVLDGVESEAWTGFECGYARARGKYLLGIATGEGSARRSRFEDMCDEIVAVEPGADMAITLSTIARELNSRLMLDQTSY